VIERQRKRLHQLLRVSRLKAMTQEEFSRDGGLLGSQRKFWRKEPEAFNRRSAVMRAVAMLMRAVAIKKGQGQEKAAGFQEMGTLRCDGCGEEFFIVHHLAFVDKWLAEKQAHWLEKVLAEEHERDKKHPDRIELPD
jgi:hypothetical protein